MYTLYFLPGACSLATQAILHELQQPVTLMHPQDTPDFLALNPAGTVPVLEADGQILNEGVAILLHLLAAHPNTLMPAAGKPRQRALELMLLANASMHPAYGRLFFIDRVITDSAARAQAFAAAEAAINGLWQAVEARFQTGPYLGGEFASPADFLLTVYARWGEAFPVNIQIGARARQMIELITDRPSLQKALRNEAEYARRVA